jgi:hypothetical protein
MNTTKDIFNNEKSFAAQSYYQKYIKYKNKYLILKQDKIFRIQTGGEFPEFYALKNISLFPKDSDIEEHLNPIYGFLWNTTGLLENYYNFVSDDFISKLVNKSFKTVAGVVTPTDELADDKTCSIDALTKFIVYLYLQKTYKDSNVGAIIYNVKELIKGIERSISSSSSSESLIKTINKLYTNKFISLKIVNITLDIPPKNESNNYVELLCALKAYLNELNKITLKPEIKIAGKTSIGEFFPETYIKSLDKKVFYVILSVLWYKFNNKQGILDYYICLNKYLPSGMKVSIPDNYVNDLFKSDELKPNVMLNTWEHVIASLAKNSLASIKLFKQQWANYTQTLCNRTCITRRNNNCSFPDCGESMLRSFINIIIYDPMTQSFDLGKLDTLGAIPTVKTYYATFNTINKQSNKEPTDIFGEKLNARDAWGMVVSNMSNIKYIDSCKKKDESKYIFEISDGLNETGQINMIQLMKNLLPRMPDLENEEEEDYDEYEEEEEEEKENEKKYVSEWTKLGFNIKFDYKLDKKGYGIILFSTELGNFEMNFEHGHYHIVQKNNKVFLQINYHILKPEEKKYIYFLQKDQDKINELVNQSIENVYFIKFTPDTLIPFFNKYYENFNPPNNKLYNCIFNYMSSEYDSDKKSRTRVNLSKLNIIDTRELKNFNLDIKLIDDKPTSTDITDIIEINTNTKNSLELMNKLDNLTLSIDEPLGNMFDTLSGLKSLTLKNFPSEIGESLNNLTNLKSLTILQQVAWIQKALTKLTNLENLTISKFTNSIKGCFTTLTNLKNLTIGNNFDKSLEGSLTTLRKLKTLRINVANSKIGDAFDNLVELETLIFDSCYVEIGTSLKSLVNLKTLIFGDGLSEFNEKIGTSLKSLVNLETLIFGNFFNQKIENSFDNLVNLKTLTFGNSFNQEVGRAFVNLVKLENLEFGSNFNQLLNDSLNTLTNLNKLVLPNGYNKSFFYKSGEESKSALDGLVNLKTLVFPNIEPPTLMYIREGKTLDKALDKLTNLENLTFGTKFNNLLSNETGSSLEKLTMLKTLQFGTTSIKTIDQYYDRMLIPRKSTIYNSEFNKPLDEILNNLINLETLIVGSNFNLSLGNSLDKLNKLKILNLEGNFNHPLGTSLDNLNNLVSLELGPGFNQSLGKSLHNLTQLETLKLSGSFNHKLEDSLDNLINLQNLYIGDAYNFPLESSLNKLTKLKVLHLGINFDREECNLEDSLDNLTELDILTFGNSFNKAFGKSLLKLHNLRILNIESKLFNESLDNSLDNLTKLERLSLNAMGEFNKPLGKLKRKLPILRIYKGTDEV